MLAADANIKNLLVRPTERRDSHSGAGGFVDHHRLPTGVHVVVHTEVGGHAVQQHPVVGGHRWELPLLAPEGDRSFEKKSQRMQWSLAIMQIHTSDYGSLNTAACCWNSHIRTFVVNNS